MKKIFIIILFLIGIFLNAEDNNSIILSPINNVPEMCSLIGIGDLPPCEKTSNNYNTIENNISTINPKCKKFCGNVVIQCTTGEKYHFDGSKLCWITCYYENGQKISIEINCELL